MPDETVPDETVPGRTLRVRDLEAADRAAVRDLGVANGMFGPDEAAGLDDLVAGSLDGSLAGSRWAVAVTRTSPAVLGAAYWAQEPFADRVWNLLFLAVRPAAHGRGVGTALVEHVVASLRAAGPDDARLLLVETSGTDAYRRARRLYAARGFDEEARIRDYYGPDDDKVVFRLDLRARG